MIRTWKPFSWIIRQESKYSMVNESVRALGLGLAAIKKQLIACVDSH